MKYKILGKTGLKVSEVGYGTWQIANDPGLWVGADLAESEKCLNEYVSRGGNFIDTAWVYGWDVNYPNKHPAEELIGSFLKKNNLYDRVIVATKIPPKNMKWPAWKDVDVQNVFPSDHIKKCVDDSLQSLGVSSVALMQFHVWQDDFILNDELVETIKGITKTGKVQHWGISVNDYQPTNCLRALNTGLFSSVQTIFNVFYQKPTKELFAFAEKNNIGIIARVPLDEGGLSGKLNNDSVFELGDFRSQYFTKDRLKELSSRIDRLRNICVKYKIDSVPELALRFILSHPQVSVMIPGMRKIAHVKENTGISEKGPLDRKILDELYKEVWERNFYSDVDPSLKNSGYLA